MQTLSTAAGAADCNACMQLAAELQLAPGAASLRSSLLTVAPLPGS